MNKTIYINEEDLLDDTKFRTVFWGGYKKEDVNAFIQQLIDQSKSIDIQKKEKEREIKDSHIDLQDVEKAYREKLEETEKREKLVLEVLTQAQEKANEMEEKAKIEAKKIIEKTKIKIQEEINKANLELDKIKLAVREARQKREEIIRQTQKFKASLVKNISDTEEEIK